MHSKVTSTGISIALIIVGLIHIMPAIGVIGPAKLTSLYGLDFNEPNLAILMRHRAVLFGLLGSFILIAAFKPKFQLIAIIGAYISVFSFLVLAWTSPFYNLAINKIVIADIVALICLVIATVLFLIQNNK